jgi:2-methylcitrate dehydratase
MDSSTEKIVEYVDTLTHQQLTPGCIRAAKDHLLDSIGCLLGGFDSTPSRIARAYSESISAQPGARVLGDGIVTAPDVAAFTNAVMLRYLDFNDTHVAASQHPSDLVPAVLATAEIAHASGQEVLLAIVLGYEVAGALGASVSLRPRGWDQGTFLGVASAMAAGKVMRLTRAQLGNALSLALVPHIPLRQTRAGELSMWKGCATAAAVRNGVFAVQLAQLGMTAPPEPFEGKDGLWERVTGSFEFRLPSRGDRFVVEETSIKLHPSEYHSQAFLDLVPAILERVAVNEIESINIETYWLCYSEIGSEPAKWTPESRETADHSLPFILATALRDGALSLKSFTESNLHDMQLRSLMQRIRIQHNAEFTSRFPEELVNRLEVTTRSGQRYSFDGSYPRGHSRNPATPAELDAKFDSLSAGVVSTGKMDEIRGAIARIEQCADASALIDKLTWTAR